MPHRNKNKLPQHGLFYFEGDQTVSVVPLKKISSVIQGDKSTKGSKVEVFFGSSLLKAEIIAVDDDAKALHELEIKFLKDTQNAHLFTNHDAIIFAGDKSKDPEEVPVKKRGRPKKHDTQSPQPKRIRSSTSEQVSNTNLMGHASHTSSKPVPLPGSQSSHSRPPSSTVDLLQAVVSSISSVSSLPLAAITSQEGMSGHAGCAGGSLLQSILPILGRLEYKIDILMNAVGVTQAIANAGHYRQPLPQRNVPVAQPENASCQGFASGKTTLVQSSSLTTQHKAVVTPVTQTTNVQQAATAVTQTPSRQTLTAKEPVLTPIPTTRQKDEVPDNTEPVAETAEVASTATTSQTTAQVAERVIKQPPEACVPQETAPEQDGTQSAVTAAESVLTPVPSEATPICIVPLPSVSLLNTPTQLQVYSSPISLVYPGQAVDSLPEETVSIIHKQANSSANFAVRLMRQLFKPYELIGRNVNGLRGKQPLDSNRIDLIKELLFHYYPCSPDSREALWRNSRKSMDSYLRKLKEKPATGVEHATVQSV